MRIIGGKFKGRKFYPPADNWPTRPTTDFAKEGLFNILNNRIDFEETVMLDLFGGTGSHGYEFISRGCQDVTYVDKFGACVLFVKKTSQILNIEQLIKIYKMDVFKFIQTNQRKYDYIFAGPPYPLPTLETIPDEIFKYELLNPDGLFVLEHNPNHDFSAHPCFSELRNYGKTLFSFFEMKD
jgi:16S rRNA (guanine(966)-N(2))-methyltransferase RsmD